MPSFLIVCLTSIAVTLLPCFEMREGTGINSKSVLAHCTSTLRSPVKLKSSPVKKKSGAKDQVYLSSNSFYLAVNVQL
jgi:hypothetical protein